MYLTTLKKNYIISEQFDFRCPSRLTLNTGYHTIRQTIKADVTMVVKDHNHKPILWDDSCMPEDLFLLEQE